jgi:hypothetical protein
LLGVNGVSIIGHRSSLRLLNMLLKAEHMVRAKINKIIEEKIKDIKDFMPAVSAGSAK